MRRYAYRPCLQRNFFRPRPGTASNQTWGIPPRRGIPAHTPWPHPPEQSPGTAPNCRWMHSNPRLAHPPNGRKSHCCRLIHRSQPAWQTGRRSDSPGSGPRPPQRPSPAAWSGAPRLGWPNWIVHLLPGSRQGLCDPAWTAYSPPSALVPRFHRSRAPASGSQAQRSRSTHPPHHRKWCIAQNPRPRSEYWWGSGPASSIHRERTGPPPHHCHCPPL